MAACKSLAFEPQPRFIGDTISDALEQQVELFAVDMPEDWLRQVGR
jgi:hypothetical protein